MDNFYTGSEVKFAIELSAPGFSMDDDDFEIEVKSPTARVKGWKNPPEGSPRDVIIFKETADLGDSSSSDSSSSDSSSSFAPEPQWFVILNTTSLGKGELTVIATAHIPDAHADDGIRNDIAVTTLGKLNRP